MTISSMSRSGSSGGILGASSSPVTPMISACASSFSSSISAPLGNCDRDLFSLCRRSGELPDGDAQKAILVQGLDSSFIGSFREGKAAREFIVVDLGLVIGTPLPLELISPGSSDCQDPLV